MAFWRRKPGGSKGAPGRPQGHLSQDDIAHLEAFASSRQGVEIYVEPATTVTPTTVALVARDGEWTRRKVDGPQDAANLGRRLGVPVYDVAAVGYPDRMRQWTSAKREAEKQRLRGTDPTGADAAGA